MRLGRVWGGAGTPAPAAPVGYAAAVLLTAVNTVVVGALPFGSSLAHRAPLYLLAVLAAGSLFGRGPAVLAALLSFVSFDFFFIEPLHTLRVANAEEWQALLVFLVAALVTGQLTALLRQRVAEAERREQEALALYEVSRALAAGDSTAQPGGALDVALEKVRTHLGLERCEMLLGPESEADNHARTQAREAHVPLRLQQRTLGVLYALAPPSHPPLTAADEQFLAVVAGQLALGLERTQLQRQAVEAEVRAAVLERTDELRGALLSSVSHDLRTPLAAIKAAAGSLLEDAVGENEALRRELASLVEREADRLNRLVGDLLDLSRIEAGALVLDRQLYPVEALVSDTVEGLAPSLARHHLDVAVPDDLPPVALDYVLVRQVLTNLLENAAKYAPAGSRIGVSAHVLDGHLRLRVEDEGPGLSMEERTRVFEPFYRAARRPGGAGLGLAVCAGFVAAHDGRIWMEAARPGGSGTAVVVELPAGSHFPPRRSKGGGTPPALGSDGEPRRAPVTVRVERRARRVGA